ncbi:MAG: homoserine O-acetyltransferase/O-succinyltransferase family protein [Pseudoramibacter sp.]
MPILVQNDLPAKKILEGENIFVMDERRAHTQEIRPLSICILNLMPLKEATELDLLRVLSNFPIQTQITLMKTETWEAKHTKASHLNKFYETLSDLKDQYFDGLIITGAPIEKMDYEDVQYWPEMKAHFRMVQNPRVHDDAFVLGGPGRAVLPPRRQ